MPSDKMRDVVNRNLGKTLGLAKLENDRLFLEFTDGTFLALSDTAQYCCESRWMEVDHDMTFYAGSSLLGVRVEPGQGEHDAECAFLWIDTSYGSFEAKTYNEHNGYYGGFEINAKDSQGSSHWECY